MFHYCWIFYNQRSDPKETLDERNNMFAALFARLSHGTLVSEDFGIFFIVFEFVQKRI